MVVGSLKRDLFIMKIYFVRAGAMVASQERLPISEWDKRLAHQSVAHVKVLMKHGVEYKNESCQCIFGKMTRATFPSSGTMSEPCGDVIQ